MDIAECDKCAPPPRNLSSPHHLNKDVFGEHFVSSLWYLVPHEMKYHLHNEYASYFYSFLKFKKKIFEIKATVGMLYTLKQIIQCFVLLFHISSWRSTKRV